jgi:RNA polymerase sigma factor (sigma-70 family)
MLESEAPQAVLARETPLDFEDFFEREHRRLGKAFYLLTGDPHEAEDLAQEALARAYERWDRIASVESPIGYVYTIGVNLHRRRLRRLLRRPQVDPPEPAADPVESAGPRADVLRALRAISVPQREALILVEWLGYDAEEAGLVLGIEAASVRGRLHRARDALRRELGEFND